MCRTVIQKCDFSGGCDKPSTCRDFMGLCQDHYNEFYDFVFEDDDEAPFTVTAPEPPTPQPVPIYKTIAFYPHGKYRIRDTPDGWVLLQLEDSSDLPPRRSAQMTEGDAS